MSDPGDFWQGLDAETGAKGATTGLHVATLDGFLPLADGFGADRSQTVPGPLVAPVFGTGEEGDSPATFAVLDAARVANLPEMLETSGLTHRCLFTGNALSELGHVGPWLVELKRDNPFTRNLFTHSDAPWHLWGTEPGILLRSELPFDALWRHLRKFTRIVDDGGKWYYWRFWEGRHLQPALQAMSDDDRAAFFAGGQIVVMRLCATPAPSLVTLALYPTAQA